MSMRNLSLPFEVRMDINGMKLSMSGGWKRLLDKNLGRLLEDYYDYQCLSY